MLLCFCYFFYLLTLSRVSLCQDIFVVKNGSDLVCVTNSSSALSWNFFSGGGAQSNYVSQYIPNSPPNSFDCEITDDNKTKTFYEIKPWALRTSRNSSISNEIIVDRRWEEMNTIYTPPASGYIPVMRNLRPNFDLAISVRTDPAGYIELCNSLRSSCLLFKLWQFRISSITLPDENYWAHFKLFRKGDGIYLQNEKGDVHLQREDYTDEITQMWVHSGFSSGLWKIHETFLVDYIYTDEETNDTQLGPRIDIKDNFTCISMIVSMCGSCQLKLKLKSDNLLLKQETYRLQNKKKKWFEIKFIVENIVVDSAHLFVSTVGGNKSDDFWAIDKVRLCQKTEFRVIRTDREFKCQLVESNTLVSSAISEPKIESTCPENTVGTFCVPCLWIYPYNNCDKIRVCTGYKLRKTACWCSAGFTNLPGCQDVCTDGVYGLSCNKTCGDCTSRNFNCDAKNGTCLSTCSKNYLGPQCDRIEVSPPYDIEIKWSNNKEFLLKWKILHGSKSKLNNFYILVSKCRSACNQTNIVVERRLLVEANTSNFTFTIQFPFEPSTYYNVTLCSNNSYSTNSAYKIDLSPPEPPYQYKEPKLNSTDSTITMELETTAKNLTVLISDDSGELYAHPELEVFGSIVRNFSKYRTVAALMVKEKCVIVIGNGSLETQNRPLIPDTSYNITYILSTTYGNKTSYKIYDISCSTTSSQLKLLSLLILLPTPLVAGWFLREKIKKGEISRLIPRQLKFRSGDEHPDTQEQSLVGLEPSTCM
ncbi:uncharacterized protein LOC135133712 isoform X1 [Zophobas morio]|uniref:uncharacterized protein LOC135133712 isoform X1 n=1 Tax=Zophobas morio TaxID=2755281 RepID=UPI003082CAC4